MTRRITKQTRRRLFFIIILTLAILLFFLFNVLTTFSQVITKNREAKALAIELNELEKEENYLNVEVEKLNDPDYIARYARERYLYSKDGEFTIKIPKAQ